MAKIDNNVNSTLMFSDVRAKFGDIHIKKEEILNEITHKNNLGYREKAVALINDVERLF